MATWEELCPEGVWPFPEWEEHAQRAGTMPKRGEAVPRRGGATSTMGGTFPIGEGLCLEEGARPSTEGARPRPGGRARRGNTQVPSPRT